MPFAVEHANLDFNAFADHRVGRRMMRGSRNSVAERDLVGFRISKSFHRGVGAQNSLAQRRGTAGPRRQLRQHVEIDRLSPNAVNFQTPVGAQIGQSFNAIAVRTQAAF